MNIILKRVKNTALCQFVKEQSLFPSEAGMPTLFISFQGVKTDKNVQIAALCLINACV